MTTMVVACASDGEPGALAARAAAVAGSPCVLVILDAAINQETFHAGTRVIEIRRRLPRGWNDPFARRVVGALLRRLTARRVVWRLAVPLERLLAPATGYPLFDLTQIATFFGAVEVRSLDGGEGLVAGLRRALRRPGPPPSR